MKRSVSITVFKNNKMLAVTNRRWGGFTLPGGKVELGEDTEQAAYRELREETGLVPIALKYLGCSLFDNPLTDDEPFLVSHYEAMFGYGAVDPIKMEEGTEPFWTNPREFYESPDSIFSSHYRRIADLGIIRSGGCTVVLD